MVLSEREKHGLSELLHGMPITDLVSLAQTCTSRLILPETSSEAIAAIILHTDTAEELLRRKKVKKELLFKYLHAKRVAGITPAMEKSAIMEQVLQLWDSPYSSRPSSSSAGASPFSSSRQNSHAHPELTLSLSLGAHEDSCSLPEAPAPSRNASYSSLCSLDLGGISSSVPNGHGNHIPPSIGFILNRSRSTSGPTVPESGVAMGMGAESTWSMATEDALSEAPVVSASSSSSSPTSSSSNHVTSGGGLVQPSAANRFLSSPLSASSPSLAMDGSQHQFQPQSMQAPTPAAQGSSRAQAQALADTFVRWFYDLLNTINSAGGAGFTPDHFWPDASAKIGLVNNPGHGQATTPPEMMEVQGSGKEVCSVITDVVRRYGLVFNPNLCGEGVSGRIDPHGLVLVSACGTLHTAPTAAGGEGGESRCCGTFLQVFGLVRDPFEGNNWKIKFTQAKMVSQAVVEELPRLRDEGEGLLLEWAGQRDHPGGGASSAGGGTTAMALS